MRPVLATTFVVALLFSNSSASSEVSGEDDRQTDPVLLIRVSPEYPRKEMEAGHDGMVRIRAEIAPDGTVSEAHVESSTGYSTLDQSALAAVRRMSFSPATNAKGEPIKATVMVPISFTSPVDSPEEQIAYLRQSLSPPCTDYIGGLDEIARKESVAPEATSNFRWSLVLFEDLMHSRGDLSKGKSLKDQAGAVYARLKEACTKHPESTSFDAFAQAVRFKP